MNGRACATTSVNGSGYVVPCDCGNISKQGSPTPGLCLASIPGGTSMGRSYFSEVRSPPPSRVSLDIDQSSWGTFCDAAGIFSACWVSVGGELKAVYQYVRMVFFWGGGLSRSWCHFSKDPLESDTEEARRKICLVKHWSSWLSPRVPSSKFPSSGSLA